MYSAVWSEGEMLILIAIVTKLLSQSLWLFIFLATWHQCNFNWCTHHECFFSTSSLGTWTVKSATGVVKCKAFRLVWTVLGTQGWVRPAFFSPISCLCCSCFVVLGFLFCFVFTSSAPKGSWCFFQKPSVFLGMSSSLLSEPRYEAAVSIRRFNSCFGLHRHLKIFL